MNQNDELLRRMGKKVLRRAVVDFLKELPGKSHFSVGERRNTPEENLLQIKIGKLIAGNKEGDFLVLEMARQYNDQIMELEAQVKAVTAERNANIKEIKNLRGAEKSHVELIKHLDGQLEKTSLQLQNQVESLDQADEKAQELNKAIEAIIDVLARLARPKKKTTKADCQAYLKEIWEIVLPLQE